MQMGMDREEGAVKAYESLTGDLLSHCGFVQHTAVLAGCSPDGYLGDFDTIVSIKCRQPAAHLEFVRHATIPADALAQLRHEVWITGAERAVYFGWNPDFPAKLQSKAVTLTRKDLDIPAYEKEAMAFLAEVETEYQALRTETELTAVLQETVQQGGQL